MKWVGGGRILFETRDPLRVGDRLRLQPKSDMAGQAWTLRELYSQRKKVQECPGGAMVEVACPFTAAVGDALFKVGAADAFGLSDEAALRKLKAAGPDRLGVRLELSCRADQAGSWTLTAVARLGAAFFTYGFPLGELAPARTAAMEEVLRSRFGETGETPFRLEELRAPDFPPLFIPPARLKEIRRELYRRLEQEGGGEQKRLIGAARSAALAALQAGARHGNQGEKEELLIRVARPEEVRWALSQADTAVVPLHRAAAHALPHLLARLRGDAGRIVWQLPFMAFDADLPLYRELLTTLYEHGFRRFEATNHGHLPLLAPLAEVRLSIGYRLFSLNSQALHCWRELGAERATLCLEDDRDNLAELLAADLPLSRTVMVYGPVEVMTTQIRMKEVSGGAVQSDRGELYTVRGQQGMTVISAATPFSLIGHLAELRRMGCSSFLLDLSETAPQERDAVVAAWRGDRPLSGTTLFNYERGLA